jgi:hypothetical protein
MWCWLLHFLNSYHLFLHSITGIYTGRRRVATTYLYKPPKALQHTMYTYVSFVGLKHEQHCCGWLLTRYIAVAAEMILI